jgi:glycine/D-amino acid oxidase-like deaminating enzyme
MKVVIVGGGLTGLCLTHQLHKFGHEVVLLEASEKLGGRFRHDNADLNFMLPSDESLRALEWLKLISPTPISWEEFDLQPTFFESHQWQPFLGFGDFPSSVVDELSIFTQSRQWQLNPGFEQVTRALIDHLPVEARLLSEVTGFECKDGKVEAVVINASEKIAADQFIFCPNPHLLSSFLPQDSLKPANRSKLAKQPAWTAVTMMLQHADLQATGEIRFVLGSGKEFEPVLGRVVGTRSVWLNLVSSDQEEDVEHIGNCVRFIKRTLKRVWPELVDSAQSEKIQVRPQAHGHLDLKLKNGAFPELSNLLLADNRISSVKADLASVAVAREIASVFSVDTVAEAPTPVLSEQNLTDNP